MTIPIELPPFLDWLRAHTERTWSTCEERPFEDCVRAGVGGRHWQRGTRWTGGLTDAQIADVEERFGVRFSGEHRVFLETLHATEPARRGAAFLDDRHMEPIEAPGFYDWLHDEGPIRAAWSNVLDGIVFDVENNVLWPDSWGARPETVAERAARVTSLVDAAPRLLPIFGHRFVLEDSSIVLSVMQADIIVYGANLREYLLNELVGFTGVTHVDTAAIPFWGELIG